MNWLMIAAGCVFGVVIALFATMDTFSYIIDAVEKLLGFDRSKD